MASIERAWASVKLLFICSRNRRRSPTAEAVFGLLDGVEAASAGTSVDAEMVLSEDLIEWADVVFFMEAIHRRRAQERFGSLLRKKQTYVLGIPDRFAYGEPELVSCLKSRVHRHLRLS